MEPLQRREPPVCARLVAATFALCCLAPAGIPAQVAPPPGPRPVPVTMTVHLLGLTGLDERRKTFDADIYVVLEWHDARLANPSPGRAAGFYADNAAEVKLREIWWPQLEFVNTGAPTVTNRALTIAPDGRVQYVMGISGSFRSDLDLRRFPFDRQRLDIRIQSFLFQEPEMVFRDAGNNQQTVDRNTLEDLEVRGVRSYVHTAEGLGLASPDAATRYSEYVLEVTAVRSPGFYVISVIVPMLFVTLASFLIYFIDPTFVFGRANILLGCLVAFVATQFAVKSNLPHVSYATVIDRLTLASYGWLAAGLLETVLMATVWAGRPEQRQRADRLCARCLPALFAIMAGVLILA